MVKPNVVILLALLWTGMGYAGPEATFILPGGARLEMVWIEPGTFVMGSPISEPQRVMGEYQHQVTISRGFFLGKYEITQAQWESEMGTRPWTDDGAEVRSDPNSPAVNISWDDLKVLIHKLNEAAGDSLYRLPTEAEWEYACRAGTTTIFSFGDDTARLWDYAWFGENTRDGLMHFAQPVGQLLPNPWGLFDMHGNVMEWCQDWRGPYKEGKQTDPTGPSSGETRVVRGGDYKGHMDARSAARDYYLPGDTRVNIGARLFRTGPVPTQVITRTWGEVKGGSR